MSLWLSLYVGMYLPYQAGWDKVSTKSPTFHGSSTVYISMKAVNQLGRWLAEIKGLPTESQDGQFQYTLIYEWRSQATLCLGWT